MQDVETTYAELASGSLKAASMEHGLQTTAIYWEGQLNAYKPMISYGQKWTWKLVDDQIRSALGLDACDVTKTSAVFYGDRAYFRKFYGDKDVYEILPAKKRFNFSFFPTGTVDRIQGNQPGIPSPADVFGKVMKSAFMVDLDYKLKQMS
mmetsp:Transcript_129270/g.258123  ORF Transcript_129270/g.258123 Transcript_129270/m.258123 type:complete len:150 (+) Transcript_129270:74-523(+)